VLDCLQVGHDRFPPRYSKFVFHNRSSIRRHATYEAEKALLNKLRTKH